MKTSEGWSCCLLDVFTKLPGVYSSLPSLMVFEAHAAAEAAAALPGFSLECVALAGAARSRRRKGLHLLREPCAHGLSLKPANAGLSSPNTGKRNYFVFLYPDREIPAMTSPHTSTPLEAFDPLLGPLSKAHAQSGEQQVCLALLALAQREEIPFKMVRLWIRSRLKASRPDVVKVADSPLWGHLVQASERWLRQQDLASSSLPPRAARRGLARVLAEIPKDTKTLTKSGREVSALRIVRARHAAAVICLEAIRVGHQGKDTVIVSDPWLAVQRNIDRGVAGSTRRLMADLGWLRLVAGGRPGFPARMRFAKLPAAVGRVVEDERMYGAVGQIASLDEPTDLVAAIFRSAAHPAWSYSSELGTLHWLIALADAAGVDPVSLGVTARRIPPVRKQLAALLGAPAERDAISLMEALDDHAIEVGAFEAYEVVEEARRAAAEERRLEVMATREAKRAAAEEKAQAKEDAKMLKAVSVPVDPVRETVDQQAARLLPKLYSKAGQLPAPAVGTQALKEWLTSGTPMLDSCEAPLRMALASALYADATQMGWPTNLAGGFAKACAGPALQAAA